MISLSKIDAKTACKVAAHYIYSMLLFYKYTSKFEKCVYGMWTNNRSYKSRKCLPELLFGVSSREKGQPCEMFTNATKELLTERTKKDYAII